MVTRPRPRLWTAATNRAPRPTRQLDGLLPGPILGGRGAGRMAPAFVHQPSTPCATHHVPISSTPSSIAGPLRRHRPRLPIDEGRQLVPPARHEPAIAPRWAAATDVRLEQDDPGARCDLGQPKCRPHARVPTAHDHDIRADRAADRRRGRRRKEVRTMGSLGRQRFAEPPRPSRPPDGRVAPIVMAGQSCVSLRIPSSSRSSTVTGLGTKPSSSM